MLRSILVPLDGSEFSERSLPLAGEVARASGAAVHLAHVHVPKEPEHLIGTAGLPYESVDVAGYEQRQLRREREYLHSVERKFDGNGTVVDSTILEGESVVDELASYARRVDSDMIFLTSHAYAGLRRAWLGSTMEGVLRKTSAPILVIHPPREALDAEPLTSFRHILVPLDGSPLAESVLLPAADLARATGARVTLLSVLNEPVLLGPTIQPVTPDLGNADRDFAVDYLERVADDLRGEGLAVTVETRRGNSVSRTITVVARDLEADLIAMATHGRSGLRRTLAGSVADMVLHTIDVPLLLVRPPFLA